ncbi:MAG: hypothetical protein WBW74_07720, partial [Xanthobacteraceae bacterium]
MADDHTLRPYRSNDQHRRATEPVSASERAASNDPLAELARLIGRSDPYAEFGRSSSRRAAVRQDVSTAPAEQWHEAAHDQQQFAGDDARARDAYYGASRDDVEPLAPGGEERDAGSRVYEEVPLAADHQGQYDDHARPHEGQQSSDVLQGGYEDEQYYQDDAPLDPREDEMYDDPPRLRQRVSLVTVLALVGCALLGTVGAYAYRSYSAPAGSTQPPPVITADNSTPTKIVPATAGDPQSEKAVQDRLANAGKEQLVSKQEEPVVLQQAAPQPAPRVVPPAAAAQQPSSGSATTSTEPKKIRTVTIRPEAPDISGRPIGLAAPAAPAPKAGTA